MTQATDRGGGTAGATGVICKKNGLYKASDGKIEFIEYIDENTAFPPFPGGTGTASCTWTLLSLTADGNRTSFSPVKVAAGSL